MPKYCNVQIATRGLIPHIMKRGPIAAIMLDVETINQMIDDGIEVLSADGSPYKKKIQAAIDAALQTVEHTKVSEPITEVVEAKKGESSTPIELATDAEDDDESDDDGDDTTDVQNSTTNGQQHLSKSQRRKQRRAEEAARAAVQQADVKTETATEACC